MPKYLHCDRTVDSPHLVHGSITERECKAGGGVSSPCVMDGLPREPLTRRNLWTWIESLFRMLALLIMSLERAVSNYSDVAGTQTPGVTTAPSAHPASSSRADKGARPTRGMPRSTSGDEAGGLPDEKAMRRLGKTRIDFGKAVRGLTYKEARETCTGHAKWVLKACDTQRQFSDEFLDYAKYLKACKAIEARQAEEDTEGTGSEPLSGVEMIR